MQYLGKLRINSLLWMDIIRTLHKCIWHRVNTEKIFAVDTQARSHNWEAVEPGVDPSLLEPLPDPPDHAPSFSCVRVYFAWRSCSIRWWENGTRSRKTSTGGLGPPLASRKDQVACVINGWAQLGSLSTAPFSAHGLLRLHMDLNIWRGEIWAAIHHMTWGKGLAEIMQLENSRNS